MKNKPYHKHDSDTSIYLGSEIFEGIPYDYYFAQQSVTATVIARFGENGDYVSGLMFIKSSIDKNRDIIEQLNEMKNDVSDIALLSRATLLSIEKGLLNENLETTQKKKIKP